MLIILNAMTDSDQHREAPASETSPLLPTTQADDFDEELRAKYVELKENLRKRLWIFVILGLTALLTLHLTFLPRTSLSRDFRRYHGIHLTKTDVKRNFLLYSGIGNSTNSYDTEANINYWMHNFTQLNSGSSLSMLADDNRNLLKYVEDNFKKFGLDTKQYEYSAPQLQKPVSLKLDLLDESGLVYSSNLLEPNFKNPAFNAFSRSGDVTADYVYVNEGTYADYELLRKNGVIVDGKIAIFRSTLLSNISVAEKVLIAQSRGVVATINYFDIPADRAGTERQNAVLRSTLSNETTIVSIPASLSAVVPILSKLNGVSIAGWKFSPASSTHKLRVRAEFEEAEERTGVNVVGTLTGIMNAGDIVIGARRDSLTSSDPLSSHAILFEVMRQFQTLIKLGWKPLRNIRFVSWDGSCTGMLGSRDLVQQSSLLGLKWAPSILAYINVDGAGVTGSKFHVDANAVLNHVLKDAARYVPIPKNPKGPMDVLVHDEENDYTTLYRYWKRQDGVAINNVLGQVVANTDAYVFENHLNIPTVNVRFEHDPKLDASEYLPNSNYYSMDWLRSNNIDENLVNHGLFFRFIGMLAICLSEHEVVGYKVSHQQEQLQSYFEDFKKHHHTILKSWESLEIPPEIVTGSRLAKDLELASDDKLYLPVVFEQFDKMFADQANASLIMDAYSKRVQANLIRDYPWYNYYKKLGHFAQFKVQNFLLLHKFGGFNLENGDFKFLGLEKEFYRNPAYHAPDFSLDQSTNFLLARWRHSTYTGLDIAVQEANFELAARWLVVLYKKLGDW